MSAFIASYKLYKFTESTWDPSQDIEDLINQIQEHGPHIVGGYFGRSNYIEKASEIYLEEINKSVFSWSPNAQPHEVVRGQCIVLIGAQKDQDKEYVYYVDPEDGSNPNRPNQQSIYRIEYKILQKNIVNFDGIHIEFADQQEPYFCKNTVYSVYKDRSLTDRVKNLTV